MSLLDALLLEPPKFDVWIALRTDGVLGSGTQADPYDGSAIKTAPLNISLSRTGILAEATLTNHGFAKDDVIIISRATNPADGDWWDGTFTVHSVIDGNRFTYLMLREPLSSSPIELYVRRVQKYLAWRFDDVMKNVPEKTTVHIGPGVFETRGASEGELSPQGLGWRPRNGGRLLGAGMGLTTLKLVAGHAIRGNWKTVVIYSESYLADGYEVADMTVDCNADDQPSRLAPDGAASQTACAAINFLGGGRHFYVRRVRAIHFGSRVREFYSENMIFMIVPSAEGIVDGVLEDCVAEFPSANNSANSFFFQTASSVERDFGGPVSIPGTALVTRHCYADGRNSYGPVTPVDRIEYDNTTATATLFTRIPHRHKKPGNLLVEKTSAGGGLDAINNGVFEIHSVIDDTTLAFKPPVDDLFLDESIDLFGGFGELEMSNATGGTIGGGVSSDWIAIQSISAGSNPADPKQLKIVTTEPHFRTTNNLVHLLGIQKLVNGSRVPSAIDFKTFPIVKYDPANPNAFEVRIYPDLDVPVDQLYLGSALARHPHIGTGSDNGITENNYISHVNTGGPYQDFWPRRTNIARNNYYHNVSMGPKQLILGASFWSGRIIMESLEPDDSELVCPSLALHSFVEFENSVIIGKLYATDPTSPSEYYRQPWVPRHGFIKKPASGDPDYVAIIEAEGPDTNLYRGVFPVLDVPASGTFTYEANGTVTTQATAALHGPKYRPAFPQFFSINRGLRPIESMTKTEVVTPSGSIWKIKATVRHLYSSPSPPGYPVNHGLQPGDIVNVTNAGKYSTSDQSNIHSTILNGFFKVTAVGDNATDPSWFEYEVSQDPSADMTGEFSPGYYGRMWGLDWMLAEGNIIELTIPVTGPEGYNASCGLFLFGGDALPQYRMRQVVFRDNLIRNIDNRSDPNRNTPGYLGLASAMRMETELLAETALWQNNVVRLDRDDIGGNSITYMGSQLKSFDNNSPDAKLIFATHKLTLQAAPELVTAIQAAREDVLIASFLK